MIEIYFNMSSSDRRSSPINTRSTVNSGKNMRAENNDSSNVTHNGPSRERSMSVPRGRRGVRGNTQCPTWDVTQMCSKEDYNVLKKQIETLYNMVEKTMEEVKGINRNQLATPEDTAAGLSQTRGNMNEDSAIAINTDKINKPDDKITETNNNVLAMNYVVEELKKLLEDKTKKSEAPVQPGNTLVTSPPPHTLAAAAPTSGTTNQHTPANTAAPVTTAPFRAQQIYHQQPHSNSMHSNNYNTGFINRLRAERERFMIVFGIEEEREDNQYGIGEMEQKVIDRYTIGEILEDMNQKQLIRQVISTQRIGGKTEGKTRPIRVEFKSVMDRETACRSARNLKYSDKFRNIASISRDRIREDRDRARVQYLANKRTTPVNLTGDQAESKAATPQVSGAQIDDLLTESRLEASSTAGEGTTYPQGGEGESSP